MKIRISSRAKIEEFCQNPITEKVALISITDFDCPFASLKNKPHKLLQIAFDDVPVGDGFIEEEGRKLSDVEIAELEKRYHSITDEQVHQIATFYDSVKGNVDVLICQCEHGQSRSAAIAAAILEYESNSGIDVFANDWYYPNKSLFRKVLRYLRAMSV